MYTQHAVVTCPEYCSLKNAVNAHLSYQRGALQEILRKQATYPCLQGLVWHQYIKLAEYAPLASGVPAAVNAVKPAGSPGCMPSIDSWY